MVIVSYDISSNKIRAKFSRFLEKFGYRLQYSVFKLHNSDRILKVVCSHIEKVFGPKFCQSDSVIVFDLSKQCKTYSYGYAKNEEKEIIFVGSSN